MLRNIIFITLLALMACHREQPADTIKKSHPSHKYTFVNPDSATLRYFETDYLPVYSDIYERDGTNRFMLTTTFSIRNTSLTDTAYLLSVNYYDSYGNTLKEYINNTILVSPLESIEFVVEEVEKFGGAGANFIIEWAAGSYSDQLLIQAVMISTHGQQGISFLTGAKVIGQRYIE